MVLPVEGLDVRLAGEHAQRRLGLRVVVERLVVMPDVNGVGRIRRDVQPDAGHRQHAALRLVAEPCEPFVVRPAHHVLRLRRDQHRRQHEERAARRGERDV